MISQRDVINAIDSADKHFSWCWKQFEKLKRYELESLGLVDFQNRLTKAFVDLDRAYRAIISEKNYLIERKYGYKIGWFESQMQKLDRYLKAIKEALGIGRTLGDGFAWIFYQDETALLEEHSKEKRQLLLPPNVGGLGERAFVEKLQGFGGMFVLYHATTSFLRLGDVSFYDPQTGSIAAIGELKTRHMGGDTYKITLGFVAGSESNPIIQQARQGGIGTETESVSHEKLDEITQKKLKRQVDQIAKALRMQEESLKDTKLKTRSEFHFDNLEDVVQRSNPKKFEFKRAGAGLMLGAWRPRRLESLGQRLLRKQTNLSGVLEPAQQAALEVVDSNFSDNCIFVGSVGSHRDGFPAMLSGSVPLMWWPISEKSAREVIFAHVIALSLFNPAHLWDLLRKRGFKVVPNSRSQVASIYQEFGEKSFELGNFEYFEDLVTQCLMDEKSVVSMIERLAEHTFLAGIMPIKTNIRPRIRF